MKTVIIAIATVGGLLVTPALAERAPVTMGQDARVRHVTFNPTDVIRIDTHLRVNTSIELGPGERINQVLIGDSASYEVEVLSNRNTISIKPVEARAATNLTIFTNRRAVAFYLTEGRSRTQSFRVVVNFPDERPAGRSLRLEAEIPAISSRAAVRSARRGSGMMGARHSLNSGPACGPRSSA